MMRIALRAVLGEATAAIMGLSNGCHHVRAVGRTIGEAFGCENVAIEGGKNGGVCYVASIRQFVDD
jgi:hypothetical protein